MLSVTGSNITFVPYGEGVDFINHSNSPNVGLRWSSNKFHRGEALTKSEVEFWHETWPGSLILEYYALRHIRQDEELTIDCGLEWVHAWNEHSKHWNDKKARNESSYTYPSEMDPALELRTVTEQETMPYASNLATICRHPHLQNDEMFFEYERSFSRAS